MTPRKKKEIVIEPKMKDTIPECPVEVPNEKVMDEPEKTNSTISPGNSVNIRPYVYFGDLIYSANYPGIPNNTEFEYKCFDKDFNEVQCNAVVREKYRLF